MNTNYSWNLTNSSGNHIVKVCSDDTLQAEVVTEYIKEGLLNEEAAIIFARTSLRKKVIANLENLGVDVGHYKSIGKLKFFDAEFILTNFHIDGTVDESAFIDVIGLPIQAIKREFGKVRVFGEIVNVLWKNEEHAAAMHLEECWHNLCQAIDFSFLCSYSLESLDSTAFDESINLLCQYHKHLTPVHADLPAIENEDSILHGFGAAWNRVTEKLAASNPNQPTFSS